MSSTQKLLLSCGVVSSFIYFVATNIFGPMQWDGHYSLSAHTISELSAIDSPSRPLMIPLMLAYGIVTAAFGLGVHRAAGGSRALRICGGLLIAFGLFCLTGPFTPMHMRGAEASLTDRLHVIGTIGDVILIVLSMAFGAAALGRRFRIYSIVSIAVLMVFGTLAGMDGPKIEQNLPTPWVGVTERINLTVFLVWLVALAMVLLQSQRTRTTTRSGRESLSNMMASGFAPRRSSSATTRTACSILRR